MAAAVALIGAAAGFALLPVPEAALAAVFAILAVIAAASDLERYEIPDWTSAALFVGGLAHAALLAPPPEGGLADLAGATGTVAALLDAVARAAIAGGTLWAVAAIYRRGRGIDGLGFGDVKLAAGIAPWLAWEDLPTALLVAVVAALGVVSVRAAIARDRAAANVPVPLGAFMAPAGFLVFLARAAGWPLPFFG